MITSITWADPGHEVVVIKEADGPSWSGLRVGSERESEIDSWVSAGGIIAEQTPEQIASAANAQMEEALLSRVRSYIEDVARSHGYGKFYPSSPSMECALSVNAVIPAIAANSQAFVAWRDRQLVRVDTLATKVSKGLEPMPTPDELIAQMRAADPMVWPN